MTIHPMIVHFPIAFLTVYAVFELLRFRKLNDNPMWLHLKVAFLLIGTAGSLAALVTGDMAKDLGLGVRGIVELHEKFAQTTVVIFSLLALNYIILLGDQYIWSRLSGSVLKTWKIAVSIRRMIFKTPVVLLLAFAGLITLTITGALGGIMVFGPDVDPVASFINKLLFPN